MKEGLEWTSWFPDSHDALEGSLECENYSRARCRPGAKNDLVDASQALEVGTAIRIPTDVEKPHLRVDLPTMIQVVGAFLRLRPRCVIVLLTTVHVCLCLPM